MLCVMAKLSIQDTVCIKCDGRISLYARSDVIRCVNCGAFYKYIESEIKDQHIEYKYEFVEYKCIYSHYGEAPCDNSCPTQHMYCKEHVSDEVIKKAESLIKYCEDNLDSAKDKLDRVLESKKIWLIKELSGLNDEDSNAISENEIGKNRTVEDMGKTKG